LEVMGNRRLSPEMAKLKGADKLNPSRYPELQEKPQGEGGDAAASPPALADPLGDPPADMKEAKKKIWNELKLQAPAGTLTVSDRVLMEMAVDTLHQIRTENLPPKAYAMVAGRLASMLSEMGMTPAARQKLVPAAPPKPQDDNPFAGYKRH
jgi:hypothetical protein